MSLVFVTTTVASAADAQRLARSAVEQGLAACVQLSAIESVYRWQGRLEQSQEVRLLFKTTPQRLAELKAALQAGHPYELPAICAFEVDEVNAAFAIWVQENTQPGTLQPAAS
jgi:periplasmic divalent cation tolerance protein